MVQAGGRRGGEKGEGWVLDVEEQEERGTYH